MNQNVKLYRFNLQNLLVVSVSMQLVRLDFRSFLFSIYLRLVKSLYHHHSHLFVCFSRRVWILLRAQISSIFQFLIFSIFLILLRTLLEQSCCCIIRNYSGTYLRQTHHRAVLSIKRTKILPQFCSLLVTLCQN